MACTEELPICGAANADSSPEATNEVWGWIVAIAALVGAGVSAWGALGFIGGGLSGGAIVGFAVVAIMVTIIVRSSRDRCTQSDAEPQCLAGVVIAVVDSFSTNWDEVLPWRAMHDRVDVIVKSSYWPIVEYGNAYVYCTDEPIASHRRSEIARCYFFDRRVCAAARGAELGAALGGMVGLFAAALIAAVFCITVILCIVGLIVAAVVAAYAVLAGAAIGGQIGLRNSTNDDPMAETGQTISVGNLVTVRGPIQPRDYDNGANVIYWADSAQFHGMSMSLQPFSYCEINDELLMDGCQGGPVVE